MKYSSILLTLTVCFLFSCNATKRAAKKATVEEPEYLIEENDLDTLYVSAPKPDNAKKPEDFKLETYNPSATLKHDILHTKLDLKFDWAKQHVIGKATITLKPFFYATSKLTLDAKGFEVNKITMENSATPLKYENDGQQLMIQLDREYKRNEKFTVFIDYTARPAEGPKGGSDAITSDQGLFFINHDGSDPKKPMQIWTQGETENNSRWFPTNDKPNERCTQEMILTVDEKFKTLSNGVMVSSKPNGDGTRTDYWKMDQPHAPYLFMIAVGEFAVVNDSWRQIDVDYYVEPAYEPFAKGIFSNTPEMLDFFSGSVGVDYPWQKYSQVIVRDYVSGAMENTTGVIFGEFVQKTDRELIDNHNEAIVAHEMFHHWFGDYVTCENWANLTLNEGFANYSEYLWFEHKYGKDKADAHRRSEMGGYLGSLQMGKIHPLIHYGYADKEDMFDAHSYNKGGMVLHMLRNIVGDEAFFASLQKYLEDNAYTAVEVDELRMAFEDTLGEDLQWFFNQWYLEAGHPILDVKYDYSESGKTMDVTIEQVQDIDTGNPPIFILPFAIDIYIGDSKATRHEVIMDKRIQTFSFDVTAKPALVNVDAEKVLLCEWKDNKSADAFLHQFTNAPKYQDRFDALDYFANNPENTNANAIFRTALKDKYWGLRQMAITNLDVDADPAVAPIIAMMAEKDEHSSVRAAAIELLGSTKDATYAAIASRRIEDNKEAYRVVSSSLKALASLDEAKALSYAKKLESSEVADMLISVGEVYSILPDKSRLAFFENNWDNVGMFGVFPFFESYTKILATTDDETIGASTAKLKTIATSNEGSMWKRFNAMRTIASLSANYMAKGETEKADTMKAMMQEIKDAEKDPQLQGYYRQF